MLDNRSALWPWLPLAFLFYSIASLAGCSRLGPISDPSKWLAPGLNQKDISNQMSDYYSKEELQSFRKLEKTIADATYARDRGIARSQIYPAPRIEKQLNKIAKRLLGNWPHQVPNYRIMVTSSEFYGALTSQDGVILIPVGLLDSATSEDEIAFILGHELGHILFLHARGIAYGKNSNAMLRNLHKEIDSILLISKNVQSISNDVKQKKKNQKKIDELQERSSTYYDCAKELITEYIHPSWQKVQEDEADLIGLELMMKAGYSFDGVRQTFLVMKKIEASSRNELELFYSEMHIYVQNELNKNLADIAELKDDFYKNILKDAKKLVQKIIRKIAQQQLLPRTHRPYEDRLEYLQQFGQVEAMAKIYDAAYDRDPNPGRLATIKASAEYEELLASAQGAKDVRKALQEGDLASATKYLRSINMNTQYGRLLKYRLRKQQGNLPAAVENLSLALNQSQPALDVFLKAIKHKLGSEAPGSASSLITRAENHFHDNVYFMPEHVYLTQKTTANKNNATQKELNKCLSFSRDSMEGPCYAAALATSLNFRDEYKEILSTVNCSSNKDSGGDVICKGDKPYQDSILSTMITKVKKFKTEIMMKQ